MSFEYFPELPTPVFYNMLLLLEPKELQAIIGNRRVLSFVKLTGFKRLYNDKHASFLSGKKTIEDNDIFGKLPYLHIIDDKLETKIYFCNSIWRVSVSLGEYSINIRYIRLKSGDSFVIALNNQPWTVFIEWINHDGIWKESRIVGHKDQILNSLRNVLEKRNKLELMPYEENGKLKILNNFPSLFCDFVSTVSEKYFD